MSIFGRTHTCGHCRRETDSRSKRCEHCHKLLVSTSESPSPHPVRTEAPTVVYPAPSAIASPSPSPVVSTATRRTVTRYRDAYTMASDLDAQGQLVKGLGVVVAGILVIVALIAGTNLEGTAGFGVFVAGSLLAALAWGVLHALGVHIAAQGQHLLAALDVAVHTSPFLSNEERLQAMASS
jgi:hypothetical protein